MRETLKTVGIYLAAGTSSRMGVDKRYLPFRKFSLGSWALHEAIYSKLEEIVVVGRCDDSFDWLSSIRHSGSNLHFVRTPPSSTTQSHSLRAGLKKAIQLQAAAVVIILADQPFVTRDHIDQLIEAFHSSYPKKPSFVASKHQNTSVPPALLTRTLFPEVKRLEGDQGAKAIFVKQKGTGMYVSFPDSLWTIDVDTPETYLKLLMDCSYR